jgi:hypothetical protein
VPFDTRQVIERAMHLPQYVLPSDRARSVLRHDLRCTHHCKCRLIAIEIFHRRQKRTTHCRHFCENRIVPKKSRRNWIDKFPAERCASAEETAVVGWQWQWGTT